MTGRLEERRTAGGVAEVVARGKRHEPIAVYTFTQTGTSWALRYSAQCATPGTGAALDADPVHRLACPGLMVGGTIDGGLSSVDRRTPQEILRPLTLLGTYARSHATGPRETRYRYEGTVAEVVTRDVYRRPIAVHTFARTPLGWQLSRFWACDREPPPVEPFPAA